MPGLFWLMHDRKLAGNIATQFFYTETWLGALLGVSFWMLTRRELDRIGHVAAALGVGMPLVFFLGLRPLMSGARAAGNMARFGQLHGIASGLFMIACVAVGVLVWRVMFRRRAG